MKVLLIEPPKKPREMMGDFIAPPIGLAQLAAVPETDDYALYDMAYPIISTEHLSRKQVIGLYNRSFASFYTDPLMMLRGLLSPMPWKRDIWRYMLKFAAKLYLRRYVRLLRDLLRW